MKFTLSAFLAMSAFLGAPITTAQAKPPRPTIVIVHVGPTTRQPPTTAFMQEGPINPSTSSLQAEEHPAQIAPARATTLSLPSPTATQPIRSFRTLAEAAKAGVNPISHVALKSLKPKKPLTTKLTPHHGKPLLFLGVIFALLILTYAVFSYRKRRRKGV